MGLSSPLSKYAFFSAQQDSVGSVARSRSVSLTDFLLNSEFFFNSSDCIWDLKFWMKKLFQNLKSSKVNEYKHFLLT